MLWIIGLFTAVLVIDCLFLILLVLVQLPKKEAGIGQAFGGSATDALFGAGSGNALTKMTKYATGIFFVLTLAIYIMYNHQAKARTGGFATRVQQAQSPNDANPKSGGVNTKGLLTTPQSPPSSATTSVPPATAPAPAPTPAPAPAK